ncbi:uncharacterized protein ACIB01_011213 [Guaruba guarouba]
MHAGTSTSQMSRAAGSQLRVVLTHPGELICFLRQGKARALRRQRKPGRANSVIPAHDTSQASGLPAPGVRRCLLAAGERWPPRLRARVRAGCSWPQPGVRAPAAVPLARRFGAALAAGRVRVPTAAAAALCPGRFVTYTDVQASYRYKPDQWHYFKQFCKPGVNSPRKRAMHGHLECDWVKLSSFLLLNHY